MGDAASVLAGADSMAGGGVPTPAPQPPPQAPPPAGPDPELYAAAVHHSRLADSINSVADILGGSKTLRLTKNADGSVDAQQVDATPAQKWGRVAQAALSGAARGFAVGQGPGGAARAAAAGISGGMAMPQAQQDQTLATAAKYNDQNRQQQLLKANIAYMTQRNLAMNWELGDKKKIAAEHDDDLLAQHNAWVKANHAIDVGPAADAEDAAKTYNSNQAVQQAITDGRLYIYHPSSGAPHAYIMPEDQLSKLNPNEQTGFHYGVSDDFKTLVKTPYSIAKNSEDGLHSNARMANEETAKQNAMKTIDAHAKSVADTAKAQSEADNPTNKNPAYTLGEDGQGNPVFYNPKDPTAAPIPAPGGLQRSGSAARADAASARADVVTARQQAALEKTYGPTRDALNFANDYLKRGIFNGPSDEALQDKFFELAKPSSGFKMTAPQMKMLNDSRDWMTSIKGIAYHATTGQWFPPKQRQQIVDTMNNLGRSHPALSLDANGVASLRPAGAQATAAGPSGDTSWIDHPTGMANIPTPIAGARPAAAAGQTPAAPKIYVNPQTKERITWNGTKWIPAPTTPAQ
jgi:hypothetical protein